VLLNLISNARQALEAAPSGSAPKRILIEARRTEDGVRIEVADNGPGIASGLRERLFQPFAGTTRAGGSGLGLAISRELVQAHGGEIVLLSSGPDGARFGLTIPDRKAPAV
jgi:signal transduction histidine kinase